MRSEDQSLLGRLEAFLGPRYSWFVLVVALVLVLLLALAAYVEGATGHRLREALWMVGLNPVIIVYILLVHPLMHRRWQLAMRSLQALAPSTDGAGRQKPVSHRGEWGAMLLGSLVGLVVARDMPAVEGWLRLYSEATSALMFALLGAAIYGSRARARHLAAFACWAGAERIRRPSADAFCAVGQSLSLLFVGGICLSLLFQSYESLRSIEGVTVYGSLIIVALTLFFMSVWTISRRAGKGAEEGTGPGATRLGRRARSPASRPSR